MQGQRYTNGVLTAIAALLGLNLVGHTVDRGSAVAVAEASQPEQYRRDGAAARAADPRDPTEGGMVSAAEQRKVMIAELRAMNARLAAVESRLGAVMSVSVKEMPQMNWPAQAMSAPAEATPGMMLAPSAPSTASAPASP